MNILTFDIEEWYLEKEYFGDNKEKYQKYDYYLNSILDVLERQNIKGTFFCVGGMGKDFPDVVKRIAARGHEIGCHSYRHVWLNKLSEEECMKDTQAAVDALEQCIGKKVKSYRAPAFSIGEQNKWVFEVLAECGITRDASIYPAVRDFGGFSDFGHKNPTIIKIGNKNIYEYPICTATIFGKEMAYSGGGYFRFFPLSFIKKEMAKSEYSMTYFHMADLVPENIIPMNKRDYESYFKEPGSWKNRGIRYLKSNLGKKSAYRKIVKLINNTTFINLEQADNLFNWESMPKFSL